MFNIKSKALKEKDNLSKDTECLAHLSDPSSSLEIRASVTHSRTSRSSALAALFVRF